MVNKKVIALLAHEGKKDQMAEWVRFNKGTLLDNFDIYSTKITGQLVEKELETSIHLLKQDVYGGDQQIGAMIAEQKVDILIFFWDPMSIYPNKEDVDALIRLTVFHNIPLACTKTTADYLISSPMLLEPKQ